jgi:hypothetical protein
MHNIIYGSNNPKKDIWFGPEGVVYKTIYFFLFLFCVEFVYYLMLVYTGIILRLLRIKTSLTGFYVPPCKLFGKQVHDHKVGVIRVKIPI